MVDSGYPRISERTQKLAKVVIVYISGAVIEALEPTVEFWIYRRVIENDWNG
jgi:hypothetical protein